LVCFLAGCSGGTPPVTYWAQADRAAANLVIGPTRDHGWLAESFAYRSQWPAVDAGYAFDDVSTYTEIIYDDQSFYDWRYGGGYTREAISVRTGVVVR
jgi:hypothetical protein